MPVDVSGATRANTLNVMAWDAAVIALAAWALLGAASPFTGKFSIITVFTVWSLETVGILDV